jgi:hypothetical protein
VSVKDIWYHVPINSWWQFVTMWNGFVFRNRSGGGFLTARQFVARRHKRWGTACLVVQIPTSQERTVTVELALFGAPKGMFCPCKQTDFTLTFCNLHVFRVQNTPFRPSVKITVSTSVYYLLANNDQTIRQCKTTATPTLYLAYAAHNHVCAIRLDT